MDSSVTLKIGTRFDFKDKTNIWHIGTITEVDDADRIKIAYMGWADKWDEWISASSNRIAPLHTHTTPFTFIPLPNESNNFIQTNFRAQRHLKFKNSIAIIGVLCEINDTNRNSSLQIGLYDIKTRMYNRKEIRINFKLSLYGNSVLFAGNYNGENMAFIIIKNLWNCCLIIIDLNELKVIKEIECNELRTKHAQLFFMNERNLNILREPEQQIDINNELSINEIPYPGCNELEQVLIVKNKAADERKIVIYALIEMAHYKWEIRKLAVDADSRQCKPLEHVGFPEEIKFKIPHTDTWRGLIVYECLFIIFFIARDCTDIWCLDLKDDKWYKSKSKSLHVDRNSCFIINGEDNFAYFIGYCEPNGPRWNLKLSLIDIIPEELQNKYKNESKILVHGFMNIVSKKSRKLCPMSLIQIISLYYSPFLS